MTTETSNARGDWVLVPREPTVGMLDAASIGPLNYAAMLAAAPPPAAARGDVRGLVAKWRAEADEIAANNWTCNSNSIRARADELEAALAAEGVQAGEVEGYDLAVLDDAAETLDRLGDGSAGLRAARARIASALSQQPEARELLDARVIDSLINANEEIHAAAAELASCLAEAIAAGATDIPLTHRAGMALTKHESLTELAPKPEARGVVDGLSPQEIERGWEETFSTTNPFCPCNLKSFTKAVRWAERALTEARNVR